MNLLLLSNSTDPGHGFFGHIVEPLREWVKNSTQILFVPFALQDHQSYWEKVNGHFETVTGKTVVNAAKVGNLTTIDDFSHVFIGGGNSFRLLKNLYETGLRKAIQQRVATNTISYMGSSAGTNMACPTMRTTNDMPIVEPSSFDALNIIPFQVNPHYYDADPESTHMGETREERIEEYLEDNDLPVIGLREGSWMQGSIGNDLTLRGSHNAKLFTRHETRTLETGTSLNFLL